MTALLLTATPMLVLQGLARSKPLLRVTARVFALALAAMACQFVAATGAEADRVLVPAASLLGTLALVDALRQADSPPWAAAVAGAGALANFIPIATFGAMPVRSSSRSVVSDEQIAESWLTAAKHIELTTDVSFSNPVAWLSDLIPVPHLAVISVGDLLMVTGIAIAGVHSARSATRPERGEKAYRGVSVSESALA